MRQFEGRETSEMPCVIPDGSADCGPMRSSSTAASGRSMVPVLRWPAAHQRDIGLDDTALREDRAVLAGGVRSQSERQRPRTCPCRGDGSCRHAGRAGRAGSAAQTGFHAGRSASGAPAVPTACRRRRAARPDTGSAASQARQFARERSMPAVPCDAIVLRTVRPPRPQYCRCRPAPRRRSGRRRSAPAVAPTACSPRDSGLRP